MHTYMSRCEQTKTDTSLHAAYMYLNSRPHTRTHECLIACTRTQNVCPSQSCQAAEDFTRALQHGGGQTGCAKEQKRSGRQGCLSAKISVSESRTCMKSQRPSKGHSPDVHAACGFNGKALLLAAITVPNAELDSTGCGLPWERHVSSCVPLLVAGPCVF